MPAGIRDYKSFAKDILKDIQKKPISFEVFSDDFIEMEKQGNEINNLILESYGRLDAVINNASIIGKMSSLSDYDLKTWNSVLNVNLTASFLLTKSLLPALSGSKIPRIIFTSSGVALTGRAFWGAYAISKAATKALKRPLSSNDMPSFILAIANLFVMFAPSASSPSQSWTITIVNTREPNRFYVIYAAMLSDTKVGPKPSVLIQHNYFGPEEKLIL